MKRLEKRFLPPDNIFKIHWVMIKTAAAAAFNSFDQFLSHIRVQILFHFRFLCSGWPGSNPMGSNTCPDLGLRPTAKKKISRVECCFMIGKLSGTQSLKLTSIDLNLHKMSVNFETVSGITVTSSAAQACAKKTCHLNAFV